MSYSTSKIRNVVLTGHSGTGKTTLLDQILFNTQIIKKAETPESGKTVSDYTQEEIDKKFSIYTTLSHFPWQDTKINIFDTPGLPGFIGEVVEAFRAAETAIMVIDAKNGVQIETIKLWRRLNKRDMPRAVFVNKMDQDRADFSKVMDDLRAKFQKICVPIVMPIGSGDNYRGIINLIEMKAYFVHENGQKDEPSAIPEDLLEEANSMRATMVELAAEGDDALIEKFFAEGALSEEEIILGLTLGMRNKRVVPVLAGSAISNNGIASLLNFLCIAAPTPQDIHEIAFDKNLNRIEVPIDQTKPLSAFIFKTKYDQFSGKLSYVKVITGTLKPEMEVQEINSANHEKIHKLYTAIGNQLKEVDALEAGDIGIIAKTQNIFSNETIGASNIDYTFHYLRLPHPVHSLAVFTESKKDEDKMNESFHRFAQEDLTFQVQYNKETKESVIYGMGEIHLSMILQKTMDKQKISISTRQPKIGYRETITKEAQAEYTHKKQSGGHGQYAKILMKMEPTPNNENYLFENAIKGGSISKGYMPGIEKGFQEAMEQGYLAGFPVMGISFTVLDGKEHPVDSSEMAFKLAAKGAFKEAMGKANPVLMEPIMSLKVFTDDNYVGDVLSDISSRRGKVIGQENLGSGINEIDAEVPHSELLKYTIDLKSLTSDTGSFEMSFSHYAPLTGKLADSVIATNKIETTQE